jgi:hypothetical protein
MKMSSSENTALRGRDGKLVNDFVCSATDRALHVRRDLPRGDLLAGDRPVTWPTGRKKHSRSPVHGAVLNSESAGVFRA